VPTTLNSITAMTARIIVQVFVFMLVLFSDPLSLPIETRIHSQP
jgi:hypothetical protein